MVWGSRRAICWLGAVALSFPAQCQGRFFAAAPVSCLGRAGLSPRRSIIPLLERPPSTGDRKCRGTQQPCAVGKTSAARLSRSGRYRGGRGVCMCAGLGHHGLTPRSSSVRAVSGDCVVNNCKNCTRLIKKISQAALQKEKKKKKRKASIFCILAAPTFYSCLLKGGTD